MSTHSTVTSAELNEASTRGSTPRRMIDVRTRRWDRKSQVRLVAGSLVLCGALRSVAASKPKWMAARIGARLAAAALTDRPLPGSPACQAC